MEFHCIKVDGVLIGESPEDQDMLAESGEDTCFVCKKKPLGNRTSLQNKAMHKYFTMLAEALNDAGYDMKRTLKEEVDIPWTMESVKEHLWRPIQEIILDKESTTEMTTAEPQDVYAVLSRHISEKFGVNVEWPSKR